MNKFVVIAAVLLIGAAGMVRGTDEAEHLVRARRESGYGTVQNINTNHQYSEPDGDFYAQPSYQKPTYKGYGHDSYGYDKGHDSYRDDGYGHEPHGYGYHTTKRSRSKLGLLALLPLLAIPALAALGIPAIAALAGAGTALVPVTATLGTFVANPGRKKREAIYREVEKQNPKLAKTLMETETIANYLENMNVKVDLQDELMYNHLACSGLLDRNNECLARLSCEFNDPSNDDLPELERHVSAIVLNNILTNKKINSEIKKEMKRAGQFGRVFAGKCHKFSCSATQQNKLYKSFTGSS